MDAEVLQAGHHLAAAADPVGPAALQKALEVGRMGGQEIPEDVHLAPGRGAAELASAHDPEPEAVPGGHGRGHPGDGVVIGQRDGGEARGAARARPRRSGGRLPSEAVE